MYLIEKITFYSFYNENGTKLVKYVPFKAKGGNSCKYLSWFCLSRWAKEKLLNIMVTDIDVKQLLTDILWNREERHNREIWFRFTTSNHFEFLMTYGTMNSHVCIVYNQK